MYPALHFYKMSSFHSFFAKQFTMYLDGYTPEEILQAKRKSMLKKGSDEDAKVVLSKNQEQELEK